ncbi:hypothetical protein D3C76_1092590 [compost metagenome]
MLLKLAETLEQVIADVQGVCFQLVALDCIEHRQAYRARHGVAGEGIEILHAVIEGIGNLTGGHNRRHRVAVANRFAHGDGIRHHALGLECPPVATDAAKPDLHLIGQA